MGVVYEHIPGSAGNVGIAVGIFVRSAAGWQMTGRVTGLFGSNPRDPVFGAGSVDVTTTTLGRTNRAVARRVPARWRIDLRTLTVQRLN